MNNDRDRKNIFMKLVCTDCDKVMSVSYNKAPNPHTDGEVTGANMLAVPIYVYPCECTKKAERDLEKLKELLK